MNFSWLLFFIPLVALGYDLYIRAEDLSIKKMGAFLRNRPRKEISAIEQDWEHFSAQHRDKLAHLATTLFTTLIILAAAAYILVQEANRSATFLAFFATWLSASLLVNWALWRSHRHQIRKLDDFLTQPPKPKAG